MNNKPVLLIITLIISIVIVSCTRMIPVWPYSHFYVRIAPNLYTYEYEGETISLMIYQEVDCKDTYSNIWHLCYWNYPEVNLEVGNGYEEGYEYLLKMKCKSRMFPSDDNPDNPYHNEIYEMQLVSKNAVDYVVDAEQIVDCI